MATATPSTVGLAGLGVPPPPGPALPARIGKYEIAAESGRGTRIQTFRALDPDIGRAVLLKVVTEVTDPQLIERFRREAQLVARLQSRGIAGIYELGEHVGLPFVAMQHLGEHHLGDAIRDHRSFTLLQKMLMLWTIAEGLRAAHAGGLSYVGLRPEGVALGPDGVVAIHDFGIVRRTEDTRSEEAGYRAPEECQAASRQDQVCDVFAFGALCYELLTGARPDLSRPEAPSLRRAAPDCPELLEQIVQRALQQDRELRYQGLEELLCDGEPVLRQLKRSRAAVVVAEARKRLSEQQLEQAQTLLREILQLDPDHAEGNELHAALRQQMQRQMLAARLQTLLSQADREAASGRLDAAVETLEAALRLDPSQAPARDRLEALRSRRTRVEKVAALVSEARDLMSRQELPEAWLKASEALECDPDNAAVSQLVRSIEEAIASRERQTKIEQELGKAKSLLLQQSFTAAIELLDTLREECPGAAVIEHWLAHARTQKAETERQARLRTGLSEARVRLAEHWYAGAITTLQGLLQDFPEDAVVAELLAQARAAEDRARKITEVLEQVDGLRQEEQFQKALEALGGALAMYPGEPALVEKREGVEREWRECQTAAAVGQALEEGRWLLEQDRPDLAVPLLREKAAAFPGRAEIEKLLASGERRLAEWQKRRFITEALNRVAGLEQRQQWGVALTVLEEALEAYPAAPDLVDRVEQVRRRLREQERRLRLGRRREAIAQKIAAQAWSPALSLIRAAQEEFPEEAELAALESEASAGLRRSECESITAGARQCLADGELDQAERALRQGLQSYPEEPGLLALLAELAESRAYREELRAAQVLFGRGQLQEAEAILLRLAARPGGAGEVEALLEAVRGARDSSEEESFYQRGREKALRLIQEQQFEPAADLLRNLLALFPADAILERDLQSALARCVPAAAAPPAEEVEAAEDPASTPMTADPAVPLSGTWFQAATPPRRNWPRLSWPVVAIPAGLLLAAGAASWKSKAAKPPAPPRVVVSETTVEATPAPVAEPPAAPPANPTAASAKGAREKKAAPAQRPAFELRLAKQRPAASLPSPPAAAVAGAESAVTGLPLAIPKAAAPAAGEAGPAASPEAPGGGVAQAARLVSGLPPQMPRLAKERGVYGAVVLEAIVDATGAVTGATVVNGHPLLAAAAREAILKWRYQPALLNGAPVEARVSVRVLFEPETR